MNFAGFGAPLMKHVMAGKNVAKPAELLRELVKGGAALSGAAIMARWQRAQAAAAVTEATPPGDASLGGAPPSFPPLSRFRGVWNARGDEVPVLACDSPRRLAPGAEHGSPPFALVWLPDGSNASQVPAPTRRSHVVSPISDTGTPEGARQYLAGTKHQGPHEAPRTKDNK